MSENSPPHVTLEHALNEVGWDSIITDSETDKCDNCQ